MKRNELLNKVNGSLSELKKANESLYRGKVFAVANNTRIEFFKTKRGAEGYIKRNESFSYYDEYTMEMVNPYSDLEVVEIKETELTTFNNAELWETNLAQYMGTWSSQIEYLISDFLDCVTNEDLKNAISKAAKEIKETGYKFTSFKDQFVKEETPEVETVEEVKEDTKETINEDVKVVLNEEKNGVELYFNGKPSEEVRSNLKSHGFRWSRYNKCWYAKQSEDTLNFANSFNDISKEELKETAEEYKENKEKELQEKIDNLNINDIETYTIDPELSRRENENGFFRTKDINHTKEIQKYLQDANDNVEEVLKDCNNKSIEYNLKMALQRFKKNYYNNYVKRLQHKASNASWIITGRAGRNVARDNKMNERYDKMLQDANDLVDKFNAALRKAEKEIKREKQNKINEEIKETNVNVKFTKVKKLINLNAVDNIFNDGTKEINTTCYNNYYIFKNWGKYRIYNNDGQEVGSANSLKDAKQRLIYLLNTNYTI